MYGGRDYGSAVNDMVEACERIIIFSTGRSDAELLDESAPYYGAILHNMMVVGEAVRHVPTEWTERFGNIPWRSVAGMRHVVVHDYFRLDAGIVISTIRTSIPALLPQLRAMLAEMDAERAGP
ncbi:MAG: HepT-like ribonuclease domain-containing protein [Coriobacteriia bacterium]